MLRSAGRVLAAGVGAVLAVAAGPALSASAQELHPHHAGEHAVFVQTNDPSGNTIAVYDRAADGTLSAAGSYPTGGLGGTAVGAPLDALASQGALTYDPQHHVLLAVNAGSDSITVFGARGDQLRRHQVLPSGGQFPVSIAVHDNLVYVLNAGGDGVVQGYRIDGERLFPISHSTRSLGLGNANPPAFISAPAQVGFSRDGRDVVVTTKNHNAIDVFAVQADGRLGTPVANPSAGAVPFAFTFDRYDHLVVTEAGASTVSAYAVNHDGTLTTLTAAVPDGQAALCWITEARGTFYGSNAGSNNLSAYRVDAGGHVTLVGIAATTGAGPIDSVASLDQRYLYVQDAVAGEVDGFRVADDGSLTHVTTITGLPQFAGHGMEGIAAD